MKVNFITLTQTLEKALGLFVVLFVANYFTLALIQDYRDINRSPQWRMQQGWDEGQNVARAMSIVKYGYRDNPIISRDLNQLFLMISAGAQSFFSSTYDLPTRITLAQRILSTLSLSLVFLFFYLLCRMVSKPFPSFLAWLCFTSTAWAYLPIGITAKEDAFCYFLVLCTLMLFVSNIKQCKNWKLYFSAFLIGMGAATKQYPLALALFYPLYYWRSNYPLKQIIIRTTTVSLIILAAILVASPNYFLSKFLFNSSLMSLLTEQQSLPGIQEQLSSVFEIVKSIILLRYREFYLALFILILLVKSHTAFIDLESKSFQVLRSQKGVILGYLFLYYAISIYKQNYYPSVRYFLIGEIIFFFLLSILLERLLQIKSTSLKTAVLVIFILEAGALNWKRGNFNYALQVSGAEQSLRAAKHSTFDELEAYLKTLPAEQTKKILSHWHVYIPETFHPIYVHRIDLGYTAAEVYLDREYGFKVINSELDHKVLNEQHPTLFISLYPLHELTNKYPACLKLIKTIEAMPPVLYTNYFSAIKHFYKTKRELVLNEDHSELPAGSTVHVYDSRGCL